MDEVPKAMPDLTHRSIDLAKSGGLDLIERAILAASSHNTQPWRFRVHSQAIEILPDFSRRCPAVDPDDHHLYASLGCAAENLLIAARAAGLSGEIAAGPDEAGLVIEFQAAAPERNALFEAIGQRQCSRTHYDGSPLTDPERRALMAAGEGHGVGTLLVTERDRLGAIADFVERGNSLQFADEAWAKELASWIRFNPREAERHGDGLYGPSMGSPSVPRWLGRLAMRFTFSARNQNKKDRQQILSSSAVAVIHSEHDEPGCWIEAGRCYQRMALQATALGLKNAFINQPVEVAGLRQEFARFLGLGARRPDLVIRIGRGPDRPRSYRRPVEAVVA